MKQVKQLKRGIISVAAAVVLVACVSVQQTPTPEQELKALIEKTLPSSVPGAVAVALLWWNLANRVMCTIKTR